MYYIVINWYTREYKGISWYLIVLQRYTKHVKRYTLVYEACTMYYNVLHWYTLVYIEIPKISIIIIVRISLLKKSKYKLYNSTPAAGGPHGQDVSSWILLLGSLCPMAGLEDGES